MMRRLSTIITLLLFVAGSGFAQQSKGLKDNLALGNPSGATDDATKTPNNFLMDKDLFALSYNSASGTPNWVSWRLVKDDFGDTERTNKFHPDGMLPKSLSVIRPSDYDHSGFDQGHMCPNGDRDVDDTNAQQTFVMTNMVPQSGVLNRQSWRLLEDHCQKLAGSGKELHIVCGPHGKGGHGLVEKRVKGKVVERTNVFKSAIGKNDRVTVPSQCWKVIVILEAGNGDPAKRVTARSEVIAVIMANDQTTKRWQDHQVSIDEVEKLTGYQFFTDVDATVRDSLRKRAPAQARSFDQPGPAFAGSFHRIFAISGFALVR